MDGAMVVGMAADRSTAFMKMLFSLGVSMEYPKGGVVIFNLVIANFAPFGVGFTFNARNPRFPEGNGRSGYPGTAYRRGYHLINRRKTGSNAVTPCNLLETQELIVSELV